MSTNTKKTRFARARIALAASIACVAFGAMAPGSFAAGPAFRVYASTPDTVLGGEGVLLNVDIQNVGDRATTGPIAVDDSFSGEFSRLSTGSLNGTISSAPNLPVGPISCEPKAPTVKCVVPGPLAAGAQLYIQVVVKIKPGATGTVTGTVSVSGGGAIGTTQAEQTMTVGSPGPFVFTAAAVELLNVDGSPDVLAASDPADYTTRLQWSSFSSEVFEFPLQAPVNHPKDVVAHLPPGLIGNPSATPALCTVDQLAARYGHTTSRVSDCPLDSQIGIARIDLQGFSSIVGLYNMVPPYGVATELGFQIYDNVVLLDAYVRPGDHGIDVVSRDTSTSAPVVGADITVWGDPADHSHDPYRGLCLDSAVYEGPNGLTCTTAEAPMAFLRMPTSCSGEPLQFGLESNSYEHEETWAKASFGGSTITGCDAVPFTPSIAIEPTTTATSSPSGVSVRVSLPQTKNPEGLAEADLKDAVVTLPQGMAINPSSADGLQVCDEAHLHLESNTPAECPNGSKIGTVLLHTQLIAEPIEGSIYLRPQNSNDPMSGEMFRMVIELRDDARGLDFKIPGQVQANPSTGQLTTTFDNNPQFPFENISLKFKAGARSPLATPPACGAHTIEANLYPWSRPGQAVHSTNSFELTSGPEGSSCVTPRRFSPSMSAGVTNVEASRFTSYLTTFERSDADQSMKSVSVTLPKGLSGSLANLPLCPEAQANAGTCSTASQIGTVTAGAGVGPTPFYVTGGRVYMTGPYEGAPFGLSVVVPAKAGPFDLGTVVVRARVQIDPHTAQITVATDPLPQIVGGVPVDLRLVNVTIDRQSFTFNPTSCANSEVTGSMTGGEGASATVSKPFQVTNCAALRFQPSFSVSTSSKTSRADGAGLSVKLTYPKDALGKDANIARVKVALPKQLPSRLTTLQKACRDSVFEANPAACPPESRVGYAKAITPIVPVPLEGPAYFVSHGGAKFPDLVFVLQGYGVTVDLVGTTFIDEHTNVTSTTFKQVPDVPVGTFELKLPSGRYSALAAIGNLCGQALKMPTAFVAQDGQEIHQSTPIAVNGCKPAIAVTRRLVRGRRASVTVNVPLAGRLSVTGNGIAPVRRWLAAPGEVSVTIALTAAERRSLAAHPGRRLRVHVRLALAGSRGSVLRGSVTLLLG